MKRKATMDDFPGKGDERVSRYLEGWCKRNGINGLSFDVSDDFWFDRDTDTVFWSFTYSDVMDKWFLEYARGLGLNPDCSAIALTLLHEIGHYETVAMFSEGDWKEYFREKSRIEREEKEICRGKDADDLTEGDMLSFKESLYEYFSLDIEKEATEWAVEFANTHKKAVRNLERNLTNRLRDFYFKNGLCDEEETEEKTA